MVGIVYDKDEAEKNIRHFYRQRTTLRYSSTVIDEGKNSGRMIRFIRRKKERDYVLRPLFFSLSTVDATRRESEQEGICMHTHIYICMRLYTIDIYIQKASKEQKKVKSFFHHRRRRKKKKELYVVCPSLHLAKENLCMKVMNIWKKLSL